MSWTEKRISLPYVASSRSQLFFPLASYSKRNIDEHVVIKGTLRKLSKLHRRWFVLYSATAVSPAMLEYHDNERKWRAHNPPSRDVVLKKCLNICRKQTSKDAKHKHVVSLFTLDDCLGIVFEDESEMLIWLNHLLEHQKGVGDGRIPRPTYEHIWQVNVKNFKPSDPRNAFVMTGAHRLCVTPDRLEFFPVGSETPISFDIFSLKRSMAQGDEFRLEVGGTSVSGRGMLVMHCEDKESAANLYRVISETTRDRQDEREVGKSRSMRREHNRRESSQRTAAHITSPTTSTPSSSMAAYRPRSESCSKIGGGGGGSSISSSVGLKQQASMITATIPSQHQQQQTDAFPSLTIGRQRTTSEGTPLDLRSRINSRGSKQVWGQVGSPLSPSPASFGSSDSTNSIDDTDSIPERRLLPSTSHDAQATIPEESSGEASVDPKANREDYYRSKAENVSSITHRRLPSGELVHYTPIDMVNYSTTTTNVDRGQGVTHYASIDRETATTTTATTASTSSTATSDYMAMTPTGSVKTVTTPPPSYLAVASALRIDTEEHNKKSGSKKCNLEYNNGNSSSNGDYCVMTPPKMKNLLDTPESDQYRLPSSRPNGGNSNTLTSLLMMSQKHTSEDSTTTTTTTERDESYELMSPVNVDADLLKDFHQLSHPTRNDPTPVQNETKRITKYPSIEQQQRQVVLKSSSAMLPSSPDMSSPEPTMTIDYDQMDYVPIDFSSDTRLLSSVAIPMARISVESPLSSLSTTPHNVSDTKQDGNNNSENEKSNADDSAGGFNSVVVKAYLRLESDESKTTEATINTTTSTSTSTTATSANTSSRFIDIPSRLSSSSKTSTASSSRSTMACAVPKVSTTPPSLSSAGSSSQSPNLLMRLFRGRTGSMPSKPTRSGRRRHRTQSEGEKELDLARHPDEEEDEEVESGKENETKSSRRWMS